MRKIVKVVAFLMCWVMAGCSLAPGPYLDPSRMNQETQDTKSQPVYPVQLITAKTIAQQVSLTENQNNPLPAPVPAGVQDYHVGAGDVLGITVWGHPELTVNGAGAAPLPGGAGLDAGGAAASAPTSPGGAVDPAGERVAADGTIYFPTMGRIHVAGMTTQQIGQMMINKLAGYAVKPQLDVRVIQYRSQQVQMAGQVKNPGALPITDMKLTVVDAITRSGGTQTDADLQRVQLTRDGKVYTLDVQRTLDRGDTSQNVVLKAGDIVYVPDHNASRVFVLGEVAKPQTLFMDKGRMTLADALSNANSIAPLSAQPRQILVIRRTPDDPQKPTIFRLDMTQVDAILLSTQFELQPLDVVYVGTADIARLNRLLDQLLPTVTSLYLLYSVGHN
ncbi:polysaccharide biosynthesis/export family protein [Paraburkholderia phosphatilytica]|uniref:polysaccharide biosynthesis/export family protein n=1 Tax=Paraburkholderia phosphatilytica TaxID=2282883 RepID=UPI001F0C760F|nr:polysaccharide biosynthesis/export family protein [Paraburkholderia phosphatilytica]